MTSARRSSRRSRPTAALGASARSARRSICRCRRDRADRARLRGLARARTSRDGDGVRARRRGTARLAALARASASSPRRSPVCRVTSRSTSAGWSSRSRPLVELVPLEHAAMEGRRLCQWDKDSCDDARFLKIDFLALGMLSRSRSASTRSRACAASAIDLSRIDFDDPAVYDEIRAGDTVGLFQIESRAQMQMPPPHAPARTSTTCRAGRDRPARADRGRRGQPVHRRRERSARRPGPTSRRYDHPLLEECLRETLGVIVFQDQVLEVARRSPASAWGRPKACVAR